jgi:hypothetical protein
MRPLFSRPSVATAAFVAAAALGTLGCEDNDSALFVRSVLAVRSPQCEVKADPGSLVLLNGVYDVGLDPNSGYQAVLLVGNQLTRVGSRNQKRVETSRVILHGAIVNVMDSEGNSLDEFTVDGTGAVDPANGEEPSYGLLTTTLVPPGAAPGALNVGVRAFGETLGGREIESAELFFPIFVCSGCLVSFPADAIDPATGACGANPADVSPENIPCNIGQDFPVDCRACAGIAACATP